MFKAKDSREEELAGQQSIGEIESCAWKVQ
jgi:hypothetical protein